MQRLIEFPLDGDGVIWVEVDEPEAEGGTVRAGRLSDMLTKVKSKVTFDEALTQVFASTGRIITKLRSMSDQPNEVEIVFGFKMNAEIGASIAKASSEANYTVTMRWKRDAQKDS